MWVAVARLHRAERVKTLELSWAYQERSDGVVHLLRGRVEREERTDREQPEKEMSGSRVDPREGLGPTWRRGFKARVVASALM